MISLFFHSLKLFLACFRALRNDQDFLALLLSLFVFVAGGSAFYHLYEGWRWLDSVYFCVTTIATIGGHGLVPSTDLSKVFTLVYLFIGVGLFYGVVFKILLQTIRLRATKRAGHSSKK